MPQPTQSDVHVDQILTDMSIAYIQNQSHFIAPQVFPMVPVEKQTNKYFKYTKADWFRDTVERRADSAESVGDGYTLSTDTYSCDVWALHKDIGNQLRANFDNPLSPDRDATMFLTQRMLLRQEIQWVTEYFATTVWGTDVTLSGTDQWSDYGNSDPVDDIEAGKETILKNTGYMPNTLVIGYQVFRKLKEHPDFVDRIKYTSSQNVTAELMAKRFDVDRLLVAKAIKNTANEGATASFDFTHGKSALLMYVNPTPSLLAPSAGYTFHWSPVAGLPYTISRFYMEPKKSDRIEIEAAWDNKVVATDCGYFLASVVA